MAKRPGARGSIGARLAFAFVAVALGAILLFAGLVLFASSRDVSDLTSQQQDETASAVGHAVQVAYIDAGGWKGVDLDATVYALDSTTIDLCLSVFPWAHFRDQKAAVKMHTLLDLRGSIPTFIEVSDGKQHDVHLLDEIVAEPGAFYVMDRAYLDFKRLHAFHRSGAFFVTRTKTGVVLSRRYSHAVPPDTGVTSDQTVVLGTAGSARNYPDTLRRVRFVDPEQGRRLIFLTNHFELPALTIAQLYKSRWRIELFFKWIKQHLRIKAFYGSSENAVKTQIWIAVASYVLIAILKKRLLLSASLHEILQVLSLNLFEKTPILRACGESHSHAKLDLFSNQLSLLDL
jgi:transposase